MNFLNYQWQRILVFIALSCGMVQQAQAIDTELWDKFQNGDAVALLRHALAPGTGDPVEFLLNDCSTQRNLSEQGRLQATQIGALLKSNGIQQAAVYSSQWCRCIDTANGLDFGMIEPLPMLNSFYQDRSTESEQTDILTKWIQTRLENPDNNAISPAILVSHQVNITALTGVYPSSGELVLVGYKDSQLVVLGTLRTD